MKRTPATLLALTAAATTAALVLVVAPATAGPTTVLQTRLTGAAEVPGPGDPDGKGNGVVRIDRETGEICYTLTTHGTAPLVAGHIHEKGAGQQSGGVVQGLERVSARSFRGCVVNEEVAQGLLSDPGDYYLNVHNAAYPGGALRGDLG